LTRVVFDLDGTLIDSAPDLHALANRLLERDGIAPINLAEARSFIGHGAASFVAQLFKSRGLPEQAQASFLSDFLEGYTSAVTLTKVLPGVYAALKALRAKGHKLGICTNKPITPARFVLNHLDLLPLVDVLIGGDSLPTRKPNPEPLWMALDALGRGPAVYVGDSEVDAETAARADIPFLLFTEGYWNVGANEFPVSGTFSDFANLPGML